MSSSLSHVVHLFDVDGALGCSPALARVNLLTKPICRQLTDDRLLLRCERLAPEGLGSGLFGADLMSIPGDSSLDEIRVTWEGFPRMPLLNSKHWLLYAIDMGGGHYVVDHHSIIIPVAPQEDQLRQIRLLELFSGAFAGWKQAASFIETKALRRIQSVAVDSDHDASVAYAISHHTCWTKDVKDMPADLLANSSDDWMICSDLLNTDWWPAIAHWSPNVATISAPCPPWSGAGTAKGLKTLQGRLLPLSILLCRWFRPAFIALEQVAGFARHADKAEIMKLFSFIGYRVLWQKQMELSDVAQPARLRWIALAVRIHGTPQPVPVVFWDKWNMGRFDPQIISLTPVERAALELDAWALRVASDPNMSKCASTGEQALAQRISEGSGTVPTFMALYGSQHTLPAELLAEKSYMGHFVRDPSTDLGFRHWHAFEIGLMHGILEKLFLPGSNEAAWRMVGNLIGPQHALIPLCQIVNRLQFEGSLTVDTKAT